MFVMFTISDAEDLCNLASEIGEMIKSRIGEQEYVQRLRNCQKTTLARTEDRKRKSKVSNNLLIAYCLFLGNGCVRT